jgi:Uma2 family endonuclease
MGSPALKLEQKWTYEEYATWDDGKRWEIIDGEVYAMSPAPSLKHQRISRNITAAITPYFKGKPCEPFEAPTDVVLDEYNVVQPDLLVVCDKSKLTDANVQGAPDLVIEILSPSTTVKDRREKLALYERFGVMEYLLIHPVDETVERFVLRDGRYDVPKVFGWSETLSFFLFPELTLNLWEIFDREPPPAT